MARPTYTTIQSGLEGWDSDMNDNITVLQGPLPIKQISGFASLPAASSYAECIVSVSESGMYFLMLSDGAIWRSIGGEMPFAHIYVDGGAAAQTLSAATDTKINQFAANGASAGLTPDHTNDKITIPSPFKGTYEIGFSMSINGSVNQNPYEISVREGSTPARKATHVAQATTGDVSNEPCIALPPVQIVIATVPTDIELWVKDTIGGNVTFEHGHLTVKALEITT